MAFSRYSSDQRINLGQQLGSPNSLLLFKRALRDGTIPVVRSIIATGADRLDSLSGVIYGDAKYWWVLAAASGVGWGLQVPPGTVINIVSLTDVQRLVA